MYSIWICPPEPARSGFQKIITQLSQTYSSPDFEPHMTLLGNVEIDDEKLMIEKTNQLAKSLKPFQINLDPISFSTTYFQNVFVRVRSTAPLMDANLAGKEIFGQDNNVFMPHMSLIYGDHDMSLREKIAQEIVLPEGLNFTADKLTIIPANPNPSDWKPVLEVSMG